MPALVIPDFVVDPPLVARTDDVPKRWLEHLGLGFFPQFMYPAVRRSELMRQLAEALHIAEEHVKRILDEADFRLKMKRELLVFESVPHEVEVQNQFVELATLLHRYCRRFANRGVPISCLSADPREASYYFEVPQQLAGGGCSKLAARITSWMSSWNEIIAREPSLELLIGMSDVFEDTDFTSWHIGREAVLDEWLARGSFEPKMFGRGLLKENPVNEAFYEKLCDLRNRAGGWWYWRDDIGSIVWVSRAKWDSLVEAGRV